MSFLHPLRARTPTPDNLPYAYHRGEDFIAGNGANVFDPGYAPPYQGLIGAATECAVAPNPFQPPPIVMDTPTGIVAGMPTVLGDWEFTGLMEGQ